MLNLVTGQLFMLSSKFITLLRVRFIKVGYAFWMLRICKAVARKLKRSLVLHTTLVVVYNTFSIVHNGCKLPRRKHKRRGRVKRG
jgi:hypothetical protein